MGRYTERFWDNQTTPLEDIVGTMFTIGITKLLPEPELGFKCEITDGETGIKAVNEEWAPNKTVAHNMAWHELESLQASYYQQQRELQEKSRTEKQKTSRERESNDHDDLTTMLIKWGIYIAIFFAAVWFAFAIVLPLLIINASLLLLIGGLVWKKHRRFFLFGAIAGLIYLFFDMHFKGFTFSLAERATFFKTVINLGLYVNILATVTGTYLLFRKEPKADANEFSKPNILLMGGLIIFAIGLVVLKLFVISDGITDEFTSAQPVADPSYNTPAITPEPEKSNTTPVRDSVVTQPVTNQGDSAAAAIQLDTNQIKSNLVTNISNVQYTDQIFSVDEINSIVVSNRVNSANGVTFLVDLTLTKNRSGQVQITYSLNNGTVSLASTILLRMDFIVEVPADRWITFRPITNFALTLLDNRKMSWKVVSDSPVYDTGSDVGAVTLPSSNTYQIRSREEGPITVKIQCTPNN